MPENRAGYHQSNLDAYKNILADERKKLAELKNNLAGLDSDKQAQCNKYIQDQKEINVKLKQAEQQLYDKSAALADAQLRIDELKSGRKKLIDLNSGLRTQQGELNALSNQTQTLKTSLADLEKKEQTTKNELDTLINNLPTKEQNQKNIDSLRAVIEARNPIEELFYKYFPSLDSKLHELENLQKEIKAQENLLNEAKGKCEIVEEKISTTRNLLSQAEKSSAEKNKSDIGPKNTNSRINDYDSKIDAAIKEWNSINTDILNTIEQKKEMEKQKQIIPEEIKTHKETLRDIIDCERKIKFYEDKSPSLRETVPSNQQKAEQLKEGIHEFREASSNAKLSPLPESQMDSPPSPKPHS